MAEQLGADKFAEQRQLRMDRLDRIGYGVYLPPERGSWWRWGGVVNGSGARRRRSGVWWGVFLAACLAMGAYVAFDILDLDGSQLRDPLPSNTLAAESEHLEAGRFPHHAPGAPEALGPIDFSLYHRSLVEPLRGSLRTTAGPMTIRRAATRARADLRHDTSPKSSPSNDPA